MVKLETTYVGLKLSSPIIVASSGLGETVERMELVQKFGAGAVVMKSLFEEEVCRQSPTPRYRILHHGLKDKRTFTFFSYEQASEWGPERYAQELNRAKKTLKLKVIPSINCITDKGWEEYARRMEGAGADAVEMNLSCPHGSITFRGGEVYDNILHAAGIVRKAVKVPLVAKLSPMFTSPDVLVKKLEEAGVQGAVIFNRMTGLEIDIEKEEPVMHRGYAGHGGPWAIQYSLRWISQIRPRTGMDIAGSGGVMWSSDVIKYILAGANAVQVCTAIYLKGYPVIAALKEGLISWMEEKGYKSPGDFRGRVCGRILGTEEIDRRFTKVARINPRPAGDCKIACPVSVPVQAFLSHVAGGEYENAWRLIKSRGPFQEVLARVCPAYCESDCARDGIDEPLAIRRLKRFILDWGWEKGLRFEPEKCRRKIPKKVAVVGAGPAGLTCAYDLVRAGYGVTVFESKDYAGGMMMAGIPEFRLPREVIDREVKEIRKLGVMIKLNCPVEKIADLCREGYDAVFAGPGAWEPKQARLEGAENVTGTMEALDFLARVNRGEKIKPGKRVAVIGGGNAAVDSARCALRLGAEEVFVLYRRTQREMPAYPEEIQAAEEEGVKIMYLVVPVKTLSSSGKVTGIECVNLVLDEPDKSGRRRPEEIKETRFFLSVDGVIFALGQEPETGSLAGIGLTADGMINVDRETGATDLEGVFAGGDACEVAGVAEAAAAGRRAALAIDEYLSGGDAVLRKGFEEEAVPRRQVIARHPEIQQEETRPAVKTIGSDRRRTDFDEVELNLSEDEARKEALRCLACGCGEGCGICRQYSLRNNLKRQDPSAKERNQG